jgi:hypothetical protein
MAGEKQKSEAREATPKDLGALGGGAAYMRMAPPAAAWGRWHFSQFFP